MPAIDKRESILGQVIYNGERKDYTYKDENGYKIILGVCSNNYVYDWVSVKSCEEVEQDNVNHPNHYTMGGIETFDYIKAKLTKQQLEGYLMGNIIKYMSRYQHKNGIEDVKKAQRYMNDLIEILEG